MGKLLWHIGTLLLVLTMTSRASAEGYVIGEEDIIQISVWGNTELSVTVPVRPDGMISMPLVGDIKAAGLTPEDLKKSLEKELVKFVKAPVVSVIVTAINSFKVYVFGDGASRVLIGGAAGGAAGGTAGGTGGGTQTSGQITLRRHTTLLQLLAQLGSLSEIDLAHAYLLRDGRKLPVNFEQLMKNGDYSQDIALQADDVIYLPGGYSNRIRVTGAVKTPGSIPYAEGMTALDAVLSAGGFTEFASQNDVLVVRKDGNEARKINVKLKDVLNGKTTTNVLLKPGDIVTVNTGFF
ncbi:MAG TPA: polysaccharide biosynthesis/export family protein [Nitrospirota bacterium]|nr:polysaccharide biosynthesis/export family protein [Nitrospirota bacterium]